jgi:hypothetical protein
MYDDVNEDEEVDNNHVANHQLQEKLQQTKFLEELYQVYKHYEGVSDGQTTADAVKALEISSQTKRFIDGVVKSDSSWSDHYARIEEQFGHSEVL